MKKISLNSQWKCKPDQKGVGIKDEWFKLENHDEADMLSINIPMSFNLLKGYELYEGVFWHFYRFSVDQTLLKEEYFHQLKFNGSNYDTKVWLNGVYLGDHDGGFTPFHFKINDALKKTGNYLVVRVDNTRRKGQLPDLAFDWFNWGGIYREVNLLILNKNRVKDVRIKTTLHSRKESVIEVSYKIIGTLSVDWKILDSDNSTVLYEGKASNLKRMGGFKLTILNPRLWSPDNPHLYHLQILDSETNTKDQLLYETHFGIRQIEVSGTHIYLNKRKLYMKGICLHEEYMPYGRTIPHEKRKEDIINMKSRGLNALRTAHYSHDEDLIDIADKLGMLILEEIPVYWYCDYKNNDTFRTAAKMMRSLIKRDYNHPSVILWSVGNEVPIEQVPCKRFFKRMLDWVRMHDDTRLVTHVSNRIFCDLTRRRTDVGTINLYLGWYYGSPRMINTIVDVIHATIFNKPLLYTEFGAGAKHGHRVNWAKQEKFSEEKQLHVLDYTIRTLNSIDYMAGWFIWVYRDFRSYLRENEFQEGYNRKGIVSGERNEKKLIYHRLPAIVNQKRKVINTKLIGILGWILLFPFAYLITYITVFFGKHGTSGRYESGRKIELEKKQQA